MPATSDASSFVALIELYWEIGGIISRKIAAAEWGDAVVDRLAAFRAKTAILPTGTGHCRIDASEDFLVIGAYPPAENWDICRAALTPEVLQRMRNLRFPASDPVTGANGALPKLWKA